MFRFLSLAIVFCFHTYLVAEVPALGGLSSELQKIGYSKIRVLEAKVLEVTKLPAKQRPGQYGFHFSAIVGIPAEVASPDKCTRYVGHHAKVERLFLKYLPSALSFLPSMIEAHSFLGEGIRNSRIPANRCTLKELAPRFPTMLPLVFSEKIILKSNSGDILPEKPVLRKFVLANGALFMLELSLSGRLTVVEIRHWTK